MDLCLKTIAKDWEFQASYNMHHLAIMPSHLRGLLLSYVAVYGPDEGVGFENLKNILRPPHPEIAFEGNEDMHRLDISGAVGRSISFSQLTELFSRKKVETIPEESWDVDDAASTIYKNPTTFLPFLTQLSLSHPPPGISWAKLLEVVKHVPTVTHLSLAFWPAPSLSPWSRTTTMNASQGLSVQYGGTNFYSHSLDDDWSEAASILRRLSWSLYNLEWLNLDGNTEWAPALICNEKGSGINWKQHWKKVGHISMRYCCDDLANLEISQKGVSEYEKGLTILSASKKVALYKEAVLRAEEVEATIRRIRGWIVVEHEPWETYDHLLVTIDEELHPSLDDWEHKLNIVRYNH